MTLTDITARVQERLLAAGGAPYPEERIVEAVREGQHVFALLTLCIERTAAVQLRADRALWDIREDIPDWIVPLRIRCERTTSGGGWNRPEWDSEEWNEPGGAAAARTRVLPARLQELDALDPAWQLARAETVRRYGSQGLGLFWVHPVPQDELVLLRVTYAADAGPDIEIPEEYRPALASYAVSTLPLALGGSELRQTEEDWLRFTAAVNECRAKVRARARAQRFDNEPAEIRFADLTARRKPEPRA
jgi:hypothetical protein